MPQPKVKAKQKPNWKTFLKLGLGPIFIVIIIMVLQNVAPHISMYPDCIDMTKTQFNEVTGTIRDLIAGKNPPTTNLDEILFSQKGTWIYNESWHYRGEEYIYRPTPYCNSCISTIYDLLKSSHRSVLEDNNSAARNYLRRAYIYWVFHPSCWKR